MYLITTLLEYGDELRDRSEDRESIEKEDGFVNLTKKVGVHILSPPWPQSRSLRLGEYDLYETKLSRLCFFDS